MDWDAMRRNIEAIGKTPPPEEEQGGSPSPWIENATVADFTATDDHLAEKLKSLINKYIRDMNQREKQDLRKIPGVRKIMRVYAPTEDGEREVLYVNDLGRADVAYVTRNTVTIGDGW